MIGLRKTPEFERWLERLKDLQAELRIRTRIDRLRHGNAGDHKAVGEGVMEMRIHYGPGYRVYYTQRGLEWILLLAAGDKASQDQDISLALQLKRNLNH